MTYTAHPVKFEIYDDTTEALAATVECFDEGAAKVEIKTIVNATDWGDLSGRIHEALSAMKLEGEG